MESFPYLDDVTKAIDSVAMLKNASMPVNFAEARVVASNFYAFFMEYSSEGAMKLLVIWDLLEQRHVVKVLATATARGLQVMMADLPPGPRPVSERGAANTIDCLGQLLGNILLLPTGLMLKPAERQKKLRKLMAEQLAASGVVAALAAACSSIASKLQQQQHVDQPQQQQQQQQSGLRKGFFTSVAKSMTTLVATDFHTFNLLAALSDTAARLASAILQAWPDKINASKQLTPMLLPVTQLAAALLWEGPRLIASSSGSSINLSGDRVGVSSAKDLKLAMQSAISLASQIANFIATDLKPNSFAFTELTYKGIVTDPALMKLLEHEDLPRLLIMQLALHVKQLHSQQQGKSPVLDPYSVARGQQQQLRVQPSHQQMLQLVDSTGRNIPAMTAQSSSQATVTVLALLRVTAHKEMANNQLTAAVCSVSGSGVAVTHCRQQQQWDKAAIAKPLLLPLMQLIIEAQALAADPMIVINGLQLLLLLLEMLKRAYIPLPTPPAAAVELRNQAESAAAAAILQSVLQLLVPVVINAVKHYTRYVRRANKGSGRSEQGLHPAPLDLANLMASLCKPCDTTILEESITQHPISALTGLEAGTRVMAAAQPMLVEVPAAYMTIFASKLVHVVDSSSSSLAAAAAAVANGHSQQVALSTFTLLLSCLKAAASTAPAFAASSGSSAALFMVGSDTWGALEISCAVMTTARALATPGAATDSRSRRHTSSNGSNGSSSSSSVSPAVLWAALAARGLLVAGCLLATPAAAAAAAEQMGAAVVESMMRGGSADGPIQVLKCVHNALTLLKTSLTSGLDLPAGTAAAAAAPETSSHDRSELEQLLQQHADIVNGVQDAWRRLAEASGPDWQQIMSGQSTAGSYEQLQQLRAAVGSDLALKVQGFAAAVISHLPLQYCCNNPGCVVLDKWSEALLVGGKGSVCGGCHAVRYCGKECQVAHWKQHKGVCKRIKAASSAK